MSLFPSRVADATTDVGDGSKSAEDTTCCIQDTGDLASRVWLKLGTET